MADFYDLYAELTNAVSALANEAHFTGNDEALDAAFARVRGIRAEIAERRAKKEV